MRLCIKSQHGYGEPVLAACRSLESECSINSFEIGVCSALLKVQSRAKGSVWRKGHERVEQAAICDSGRQSTAAPGRAVEQHFQDVIGIMAAAAAGILWLHDWLD